MVTCKQCGMTIGWDCECDPRSAASSFAPEFDDDELGIDPEEEYDG